MGLKKVLKWSNMSQNLVFGIEPNLLSKTYVFFWAWAAEGRVKEGSTWHYYHWAVAEISESLERVSVSTIFAESRKVLVSKNQKLQSREILGLVTFKNLQSWKVSVSKIQKKWFSKKSQCRQFPLNSLRVYFIAQGEISTLRIKLIMP